MIEEMKFLEREFLELHKSKFIEYRIRYSIKDSHRTMMGVSFVRCDLVFPNSEVKKMFEDWQHQYKNTQAE